MRGKMSKYIAIGSGGLGAQHGACEQEAACQRFLRGKDLRPVVLPRVRLIRNRPAHEEDPSRRCSGKERNAFASRGGGSALGCTNPRNWSRPRPKHFNDSYNCAGHRQLRGRVTPPPTLQPRPPGPQVRLPPGALQDAEGRPSANRTSAARGECPRAKES